MDNLYLGLREGYILTILLPIHLLIYNVLYYVKQYFKNKFKYFMIGFILFSIISSAIFYFFNYSIYFVAAWGTQFLIVPFFYGYIIIRPFKDDIMELNIIEKFIYSFDILFGIVLIIIPCTPLFKLIGAGTNIKIDVISTVLYILLGLSYIIFNKITLSKIIEGFQ